jgi:NAD(P)-dependent dehydrogenase (short-subunit alcohol dehydrogenase family)
VLGRTVIVTGAGGGIGAATCRRLAADGMRVFAVDRDTDALARLGDLHGTGHSIRVADLADIASHDRILADATAAGPIVGLVHMAAVLCRRHDIDDITEQDWDVQINVNLKATFFLNRAVARTLKRQGAGGTIVNFSSQAWWSGGYGGSVVYAASKGGVVSMTRGLARSLAPYNIRVNAVAPGFVQTSMMLSDMSPEQLAQSVSEVPLGRMAKPEEVADVVSFLISEDSRYITGTTLNVTGGQLMY